MERSTNINIVVCGLTGVGKSTLCNAITGKKDHFKVGDEFDPVTKVKQSSYFEWPRDGPCMKLTVHDTVGFCDGNRADDKYDDLTSIWEETNILLYCIHSSLEANKLGKHKKVIGKLSAFIDNIIIVLTKSDTLIEDNLPLEQILDSYNKEMRVKTKVLNETLLEIFDHPVYIVNTAEINTFSVIPGDQLKQPWLPLLFYEILKSMDLVDWFSSLQKHHPHTKTLKRLDPKSIEMRYKFLIAPPDQQPDPNWLIRNKKTAIGVGVAAGGMASAAIGATVGGTIGALAIGLPTFGAAAGVGLVLGSGIGALAGTGVGAGVAAVGVKLSKNNSKSSK